MDSFEGLNKDVWILASMMFINRLGNLIFPFLTLYATQSLGWTELEAGAAITCWGVGSLFGAILGGYLVDKIGYYKTMVLSLFSASIFFFFLQFLEEYYIVCAFLLISSLLADLLRPGVMTGITYVTDESTKTRAVSLLRIAFNLGLSVGPAIAGILIEMHGYQLIFNIDAITCVLAGVFMLLFVKNMEPESMNKDNIDIISATSPYKDKIFLLFMFFSFLMLVCFFQMLVTVPLFMVEELGYTEKHIGWFFGVNGMLIVLTEMPIIHYLENKIDGFKAMTYGALMMGFAVLAFVFPFAPIILIGTYTIFVSFGEIINFPFIATISMDRANESNIGKYMGVNTVVFSLALVVAPIAGTGLLASYGYDIMFSIMFGLCIISVIGLHFIKPYCVKAK